MWDLHERVEWLLGSNHTKILFKYMVESSNSALLSMRLSQFSIHLYRKLIYVIHKWACPITRDVIMQVC